MSHGVAGSKQISTSYVDNLLKSSKVSSMISVVLNLE